MKNLLVWVILLVEAQAFNLSRRPMRATCLDAHCCGTVRLRAEHAACLHHCRFAGQQRPHILHQQRQRLLLLLRSLLQELYHGQDQVQQRAAVARMAGVVQQQRGAAGRGAGGWLLDRHGCPGHTVSSGLEW
jgi:hypothetical protein